MAKKKKNVNILGIIKEAKKQAMQNTIAQNKTTQNGYGSKGANFKKNTQTQGKQTTNLKLPTGDGTGSPLKSFVDFVQNKKRQQLPQENGLQALRSLTQNSYIGKGIDFSPPTPENHGSSMKVGESLKYTHKRQPRAAIEKPKQKDLTVGIPVKGMAIYKNYGVTSKKPLDQVGTDKFQIKQYKSDYEDARRRGDIKGMKSANEGANKIRQAYMERMQTKGISIPKGIGKKASSAVGDKQYIKSYKKLKKASKLSSADVTKLMSPHQNLLIANDKKLANKAKANAIVHLQEHPVLSGALDKLAWANPSEKYRQVGDKSFNKFIDAAKESSRYKIGSGLGELGNYAMFGGLGMENAISRKLADEGLGVVSRNILSNVGSGIPYSAMGALQDSNGIKDFAKNMLVNTAIDVGGGAIMGRLAKSGNPLKLKYEKNPFSTAAVKERAYQEAISKYPMRESKLKKTSGGSYKLEPENKVATITTNETQSMPKLKKGYRIQQNKDGKYIWTKLPEEQGGSLPAVTNDSIEHPMLPKDVTKVGSVTDPSVVTKAPNKFKQNFRALRRSLVSGQESLERMDKKFKNANINAKTQGVRTATTQGENILTKGLSDMNGKNIGESFVSVIKRIPKVNRKKFNEYLVHKHNIDRAELGTPIMPGWTKEYSEDIVKNYELTHPEFINAQQNLVNWWNRFSDEWRVKSGLISQEEMEKLREMYPNYVPVMRDEEFTTILNPKRGLGVGNKEHVLKTANFDVKKIEDNMSERIMHYVEQARKNELLKEVHNTIEANGNSEFGFLDTPNSDGRDYFGLNFLDNGEAKTVNVSKDVNRAFELLDNPYGKEISPLTKGAKGVTNVVKFGATGINLPFMFKNLLRDITTYHIQTDQSTIRAMVNYWRAIKQVTTNGKIYKQYKALGGKYAGRYNQNKGFNSVAKRRIRDVATKPFSVFGEAMESVPRVAEFMGALQKDPENPLKALQKSADVTVNFSRSGDVAKIADSYIPYLNASMQGLDKFVRILKEHPIRTPMRATTLIAAPIFLLYQINKDNPHYQALDNRTKQNYFVIPDWRSKDKNGNPKTFFRLPLNKEYGGIIGGLSDVFFDHLSGDKDSWAGFLNTMLNNVAPASDDTFNTTIGSILRNEDFAGRKIVPSYLENVSPELQQDYNTSGVAKGLSSLSRKFLPGTVIDSPMKTDYLLKSFFGFPAQTVQAATNNNKTKAFEKLLLDPFKADPRKQNGLLEKVYENAQKAKMASDTEKVKGKRDEGYKTPTSKKASLYQDKLKEFGDLTKKEREILNNKKLSNKEKDKLIEEIKDKRYQLSQTAEKSIEKDLKEFKKTYVPELSNKSPAQIEYYNKYLKSTVKPKEFKKYSDAQAKFAREYGSKKHPSQSKIAAAMAIIETKAPKQVRGFWKVGDKDIQKAQNLKNAGVTLSMLKDIKNTADTDGNNSLKKDEIVYKLNKTKFNKEQKAVIFAALSQSKKNPFIEGEKKNKGKKKGRKGRKPVRMGARGRGNVGRASYRP